MPARNTKEANGLAVSCSLLFRREQTLSPQGADWQSVGLGLKVCINKKTVKLHILTGKTLGKLAKRNFFCTFAVAF
jgi:hypothetical protein